MSHLYLIVHWIKVCGTEEEMGPSDQTRMLISLCIVILEVRDFCCIFCSFLHSLLETGTIEQ